MSNFSELDRSGRYPDYMAPSDATHVLFESLIEYSFWKVRGGAHFRWDPNTGQWIAYEAVAK